MNYQQMAKQAGAVRTTIATASTNTKNAALLAIRDAMAGSSSQILKANQKDLEVGRNNGLDEALLDRLELNNARIDTMIEGVEQIVALPDPVGEVSCMTRRPSGSNSAMSTCSTRPRDRSVPRELCSTTQKSRQAARADARGLLATARRRNRR